MRSLNQPTGRSRVASMLLVLAVFFAGHAFADKHASGVLSSVALLGDSEIAGGNIGRGLSCVDKKNTVAYGNATASNYIKTVGHCHLKGSYQPKYDGEQDLCQASANRFEKILSDEDVKINTVVIALGDNPNNVNDFETMLQDIKDKHKKCIYIVPAAKSPDYLNWSRNLAIKKLKQRAATVCQVYDPSADGEIFQAFGGHYPRSVGQYLGAKICKAIEKMDTDSVSPDWTDAPTPPHRPVDDAPVIR